MQCLSHWWIWRKWTHLHTQLSINYCESNAGPFNSCLFGSYCKLLEGAENFFFPLCALPYQNSVKHIRKRRRIIQACLKFQNCSPKVHLAWNVSSLSITITFCLCNRFMPRSPELSLAALFSLCMWIQTHLWGKT